MINIIGRFLAILLVLLTLDISFAESKPVWMIDLGGGICDYSEKGYSMISGYTGLSRLNGDDLIKIRHVENSTINVFGPGQSISDTSILMGKNIKLKYGEFSIAGGIGSVAGTYGTAIGLPLEASYSILPLSFLGFGISTVGDINSAKSFISYLFVIQGVIN